ncbi:zinc-binding dehydrogenase [Jatrophihabitans cynanchi]|uniref:Zinc-binding dehydrogenase n=1 Tax=Jatrophihabitans cynanchi TaxID=2944128 RepID=A0ABY7JZ32_9ACTN|nr:zinc-binding dehydrogenase [Jatrophihabitans sp. SB3-54]WAX56326.1 zinc-binding dehydrogenase [Jatrophihabitans sp. SB3-54]
MKAAVLVGPHRWVVDEVPDPVPGPGQVLIGTHVAAICGSDLHAAGEAQGALAPGAPGHEAVGTVLSSRTDALAPGARVLCAPPAATARCFAQLQVLPAESVVPLPATCAAHTMVTAQQLGTAIFALKRFWPSSLGAGTGRSAAVLGCGPAGLAFVQLLRRAGFAPILASDTSPVRLAAASEFGATSVVRAPDEDALAAALELTAGVGIELVIEAAGRDVTRHQAMRMVRLDGRIGLFGLEEHPGLSTFPLAEVFRRRPTVEMAWGAQFEPGLSSMHTAVQLILSDPEPAKRLVSHRFPLERIGEAFELARDPARGSLKVAVEPAG